MGGKLWWAKCLSGKFPDFVFLLCACSSVVAMWKINSLSLSIPLNPALRRRDISCNGKGTLHRVLRPKPHHAALVCQLYKKPFKFKIYPSNRLHFDMASGQSSDNGFKMQHCRHSSADISSSSFNSVAVIARSPTMTITMSMSSNNGILTQHFLISL